MTIAVSALFVFLGLALLVGLVGAGLGAILLAPRLSQLTDHTDEEPSDRDA
ncbi:MAG: hypothetical protein V4515_02290 [Chloroflexota bacterium]